MLKITLPYKQYLGISTGVASALIIDESQELLLNSPIVIEPNESPDTDRSMPLLECSVNMILTAKEIDGLKKDHSLVFVSVVKHHVVSGQLEIQ